RREATAHVASERMLGTERVELSDDHAPDVVAMTVCRGQRGEELLERRLELATVKRGERTRELVVLLQAHSRGKAFGLEAVVDRSENLERLVLVAPRDQYPRKAHGGVRLPRLELQRPSQVVLTAACRKRVGLGGHEPIKEALHGLGAQRAHEFVHEAAVAERLHRRDATDV